MGKGMGALIIFMVFCLISGIGLNFFVLQVWAMAADSIDEIEVKTGTRDDGTAYSFFMFFRKLGQVIAAVAVNGTLLAMHYYDTASTGSFVFSDNQLKIMFILSTVIPAAMFGVMAIILLIVYPLSKKKVAQLQVDKEAKLQAEADEKKEEELAEVTEEVGYETTESDEVKEESVSEEIVEAEEETSIEDNKDE